MSLPERIGKYEIRRKIGKGAMGTVYEGFDPVIERPVAIKTILAEYLATVESESAVARFKREAQACGRLQHPAIVGVYEYGEDEEMAFIVMEYVQGQELRKVMQQRGGFELIDVFEVMKQLLAALDYSHKHGVVHRDIKPANIMVLAGMKIKVMDFGIARIQASSLTQVGTLIGTPTHIAPEQLRGEAADSRADLWAAGVILYELLTGHGPFLAETPAAVMHNVMYADPAPPSSMVPFLPPVFDALVARALAKEPDSRFQSGRDFANALVAAFIQAKSGGGTASSAPPRAAQSIEKRAEKPTGPPGSMPVLPPETLAEIESSLIRSIGPLARILVRKGATQARNVEEFYSLLAENVPPGSERADFLKRIEQLDKAGATSQAAPVRPPEKAANKPAAGFDPAMLAAAEKRLAQYVGPLAKVLIKRAANDSGDVKELYRKLAEHIDSQQERAAFLAGIGQS